MAQWNRVPLIDYIELIGGGTPKTTVPEYWNGNIPWLSVKDFNNDKRYVYSTEKHISQSGFEHSPTKMLHKDDIIISARGTVGEIAMIPFDMAFNQSCYGIRASRGIDKPFLYYLLKNCISQLKRMTHGSVFDTITRDTFANIEVDIPDSETQKRISSVLADIDNKIEVNDAINDNLQQQAFSVFDNLIANAENNDYTVSDYAFLNPKRTLAKNQVARSIDMSQLSTSGAFPSGWEMKPFNGGMRFTNGDTLLARITPCLENGKTAFIDFLDDGEVAFGSTEYIVLAPKNDTPPEMLYCLARYPAFVDYAVKNMNGSSGRQRVSAETVGQYRLPLFDKHSLVLFKEVVSPMFLKMRYNSLENMRLAELRDALLPKLMSGEIDVSAVQL